jgi:hypothetical protein
MREPVRALILGPKLGFIGPYTVHRRAEGTRCSYHGFAWTVGQTIDIALARVAHLEGYCDLSRLGREIERDLPWQPWRCFGSEYHLQRRTPGWQEIRTDG